MHLGHMSLRRYFIFFYTQSIRVQLVYKVTLAFVLTRKVICAFGTRVNINANFAALK